MADVDHAMSEAVRAAYARGEEEETMAPLVRVDGAGRPVGRIRGGDTVIFYDIRGEREVELTSAFVDRPFAHFPVDPRLNVGFVTMVQYDRDLPVRVAFPPVESLSGTLAETVSRRGLRQVKVSESEKAIHLGYFLNGKRKDPFAGESRVLVRSPEAPLAEPEMRAEQVADALIDAVADPGAALVVGNFANVDVVGHSEDRAAILRAVEAVDRALARVLDAARRAGTPAIVTADHGTVERWLYPDGAIDTGHTTSPVPFALVCPDPVDPTDIALHHGGSLVDVAPTLLDLLGIDPPPEMTGRTLLDRPWRARTRARALLVLCDGWGLADPGPGNLISAARTPTMDGLLRHGPATALRASGEAVGLPADTVGNSEAGHLHIGAGRVVESDRIRIEKALGDGSFHANPALRWASETALQRRTRLHLLGIISFFSSHGSIQHLLALLDLAKRAGSPEVYVHGLLGRRGERPESGAHYIQVVEDEMVRLGVGTMASVIGRHWALDREQNWDRIEKTHRLLVDGAGLAVR